MKNEWDDYADEWDSNADVNRYAEQAFSSLLNVVSLSGSRILDFGCGTGSLTEKMAQSAGQIVALDNSTKMIEVLKKKKLANVQTFGEELSEAAIKENKCFRTKFDLITASSVCSFLPDYGAALNIIGSLLVPGGYFVQWDWMSTKENPEHGLSETRIKKIFNQVDLELVSLTRAFAMDSKEAKMTVLMGVGRKPVPKSSN
ncbi:MAG: class I SAM-dependent methyltransferase [SAR324 cluster bacterium]|nr:class I SAM-dependent methyltransferase [SAR324 cluster bacterium]